MERIENYICGELRPPTSGGTLENFDPSVGQVYGTLPDSDGADIGEAVDAAAAALPRWSTTSAEDRATLLERIASAVEARLEELALAECIDNGKPLSVARTVDIPRAVQNFRFFARAITQFSSESHPMGARGFNYTLRQPVGVVGCISPWNLPLYLFTWKICPALAAGNTVVAKPSEVTPMTASLLGKICAEVGLPAGVLNIVHGQGSKTGAALVENSAVKAISFTGGTATGAQIARVAAPQFKKLSLELGGKNPSVVFADCDRDKMFDTVVRAAFANQGQICLCGSRIFVERAFYPTFRDEFVRRVRALAVGDPLLPQTQQGALVSEAHTHKVLDAIEQARGEGGRVLCGGRRYRPEGRCRDGWFVEPTVIEGLDARSRTNQEEIFGPVATLVAFDEPTLVEQINSTRYGLAASLWSRDIKRCHRLAASIESGIVWINCWMVRDLRTPFGGIKDSGVGREGGLEALRFFSEPKNVCVDLT